MRTDLSWMKHAVRLARKAFGFTSPNPHVGAVIVKDGVALGEGWHHKCGCPHAEIEALRSLSRREDARGATLYVTLEPCSTFGRTPPCCDAIIQAGIARVVVGSLDPNPKHAGRGIELLRSAGIEVETGVAEKICSDLNQAFFHWIVTGKPFVLLKLAETLDGKIAAKNGRSQWITAEPARRRVRELRLWADAVLGGAETFRLDHPRFTARDNAGNVLKTPRRFILTHQQNDPPEGWENIALDSPSEWQDFLLRIGRENVLSLLIEGGGEAAAAALNAGIVDEIEFHIAPKILGGRNSRPAVGGTDVDSPDDAIALEHLTVRRCGPDLIVRAKPRPRGTPNA